MISAFAGHLHSNEKSRNPQVAHEPISPLFSGGEGGIRTHGTREGSTVFETARFNRSRTSPFFYPTIPNNLDQLSLCRFLHGTRYCHYFVTAIRLKPNRASFGVAIRVSVSHRHGDGRMPQQLFHGYKIGASPRQPRRERLPRNVMEISLAASPFETQPEVLPLPTCLGL